MFAKPDRDLVHLEVFVENIVDLLTWAIIAAVSPATLAALEVDCTLRDPRNPPQPIDHRGSVRNIAALVPLPPLAVTRAENLLSPGKRGGPHPAPNRPLILHRMPHPGSAEPRSMAGASKVRECPSLQARDA